MRSRTRVFILIIVVAAIGAYVTYVYLQPSRTPTGQPPLAEMSLSALRDQFNHSSDCVRVVALLSPT